MVKTEGTNKLPENVAAAKTLRFLSHCLGRIVRMSWYVVLIIFAYSKYFAPAKYLCVQRWWCGYENHSTKAVLVDDTGFVWWVQVSY